MLKTHPHHIVENLCRKGSSRNPFRRHDDSTPTNSLGKSLLHTDVQRQELRRHLLEEVSLGIDRCQRMDLLSFLVGVGEHL